MQQFRPKLNMNRRPQTPMVNNVLSERHTIPVKATRYFTDVNGQILLITDPLIIAAGLNVKWPVLLFGVFDQNGGYSIAQKICGPVIGDYLFTFVNGNGQTSASVIGFTGLNEIQAQLKPGDIVQVYTDNAQNPSYFIWIVLNNSYTGLGSIVQNLNTSQNDGRKGKLKVSQVKMYYGNVTQLNETVNFTIADNLGTFRNDSIQPYLFRNPYDGNTNFVDMETNFDLSQFLGVNTYLGVDSDNVSFDFLVEN